MVDIPSGFFSSASPFSQKKEEKGIPEIKTWMKRRYEKYICTGVESLKEICSFPIEPGEQYRIVTTKSISALTAVKSIIERGKIEEITIAIYRMNLGAVSFLQDLCEDGIKINLLLSSFFRENKKYEAWTRKIKHLGEIRNNLKVEYCYSHAKIALIKTAAGEKIVFEGPGNMAHNARIEQYILENNADVYDFHYDWILKIINEGE